MANGNIIEKYVIFDTDLGTDDAWALLMLLKAEKQLKNVKILAITCVNGNTTVENVIRNTYHILRLLDRTDIPIYKGANEPLITRPLENYHFHGLNGMADIDFWNPKYPTDENELIRPESAVQIIRDLIMQYPNKISLIGLGPLTNFALAVKMYPQIKDRVKDIHLMGGTYKGQGNITSCAEFNFYSDAEGAHIVLDSYKCPINIIPRETCVESPMSLEWRFETFKDAQNPAIQLLNEADKFVYRRSKFFRPYDAYAIAAFLFPDKCIEKRNSIHVSVEIQGDKTRAQMILDHRRKIEPNATIFEQMNAHEVQNAIYWTGMA